MMVMSSIRIALSMTLGKVTVTFKDIRIFYRGRSRYRLCSQDNRDYPTLSLGGYRVPPPSRRPGMPEARLWSRGSSWNVGVELWDRSVGADGGMGEMISKEMLIRDNPYAKLI